MAKKDHRSARALAAAERLFKRKPDASTGEFRKVCERADSAIKKLTNREFNASYVLPFKRRAATKGKAKKRRKNTARWKGSRGAKLSAHEKIVRMIRERDAQVLEAAGDPTKAYAVAARTGSFVSQVLGELAD